MNMHESALARTQQIIALQEGLLEQQHPLLQEHRDYALSLYERLPDTYAVADLPIAWDTVSLQDFYITPTIIDDGVRIYDIRDFARMFSDLTQRYVCMRDAAAWTTRKPLALVEACFNRGAVIVIPSGVRVVKPLELTPLLGGYRQQLLLEKIVVIVGAGARVTFHDTQRSATMGAHMFMRAVDYHVGEHAQIVVEHDQQWQSTVHEYSRTSFYSSESSSVTYSSLITGGAATTAWLDAYMVGERAECSMVSAYAARNQQTITLTTLQEHVVPHCSSTVVVKGCLYDQARADYTGTINVHAGAQHTQASQDQQTILMSSQARAHAMPRLQVLANEVQCAHGSAVGQLDCEQLIYLQSRGLDAQHAERLVLQGFFADAVAPKNMERVV